jgi:hypothetical protein
MIDNPHGRLELAYRRLLRWLPADYRAEREDEMLGVLLLAARPGQRRPDPADAADLLLGVAVVWRRRLWARLRPRLPLILAAAALLAPAAVAMRPGASAPPAEPGRPATLPARFAAPSGATGSVSDAPPGRAIALYQQGSEAPYDMVLSADRDAYRKVDLAAAHRAGGDAFDTPAPALLSPDGGRVAVGYFHGKTAGLAIQDLSTGDVTTHAVPTPGGGEWGAGTVPLAWSAAGDRIALLSTAGEQPPAGADTGDLSILEPHTGRATTVLRNARVAAVAFAPDGELLAVQDPASTTLRLVTADGTTRRTLELPAGTGLPGPAAWSPDGRLVAVSRMRAGCPDQHDALGTPGWCSTGETRFLDATGAHRPVPPPLTGALHRLAGWSGPDRVVLVEEDDAGRTTLVEAGLDGGRRVLSTIPAGADAPLGSLQLAGGLLGDLRLHEPVAPDLGRWPLPWRLAAAGLATAAIWAALATAVRLARHRRRPLAAAGPPLSPSPRD